MYQRIIYYYPTWEVRIEFYNSDAGLRESQGESSKRQAGKPNPTSSRRKSQRNANIAVTRITRELFGSVSSTLQHAIQAGSCVHCPSVNPLPALSFRLSHWEITWLQIFSESCGGREKFNSWCYSWPLSIYLSNYICLFPITYIYKRFISLHTLFITLSNINKCKVSFQLQFFFWCLIWFWFQIHEEVVISRDIGEKWRSFFSLSFSFFFFNRRNATKCHKFTPKNRTKEAALSLWMEVRL